MAFRPSTTYDVVQFQAFFMATGVINLSQFYARDEEGIYGYQVAELSGL